MLFIPYRLDTLSTRLPFVTILLSIVCLAIYIAQYKNEIEFVDRTTAFCQSIDSDIERMMLEKISLTDARGGGACDEFLYTMGLAEDVDSEIEELVRTSEGFVGLSQTDSSTYMRQLMNDVYDRYARTVPPLRTKELWYHPHSWNPWAMVTASFAHGSWDHLIGNMIFFFAFAAGVEIIVGPLLYLAVVTAMVFGTGVSYSYAMMGVADALPTLGLSGVVMGMMAMLAFFVPLGRIHCFYWILIRFGTVSVPVWILALWYIGFDAYQLFALEQQSGVNLVYHVSGAVIGLTIGFAFFRRRRLELAERVD